jgi:hypothetical protein
MISSYLLQKRLDEIKFLASTIEYKYNFKLKKNNATQSAFHELIKKFNIKTINGHLFSAMNKTLYKMDFYPESKQRLIKNSVYTNYVLNSSLNTINEYDMPRNYRYSKIIHFLESKYKLGMIWTEIPLNDFIKLLFEKIDV